MVSIDEKRVYDDRGEATTVLVADDIGVVTVSVSDDIVGEFGVAHRCSARDVAARDRTADDERRDGRPAVAVATDEAVLDGAFEPLGFGPAVAVGFDGDVLLAASPDGTLERLDGDDGWRELGAVGDVRAIDGDLVATVEGVYRALDDGVQHVGLDDASDVAAAESPLAATGTGLYGLGNGWRTLLDGDFRVVGADAGRAHAATDDALFARRDDEWREESLPVDGPVADVGYGEGTYVVAADGTFLATVGDGWRHRGIGLRNVNGLAVA
ncbi:hypothetical protein DMJ13_01470 [halophilic archaeon]|nr:hypothetical protein DMJ13_01470 [halophilic archaeon]